MPSRRWFCFSAAALLALSSNAAFAVQGRGKGHNKHDDQDDDDDRGRGKGHKNKDKGPHGYSDHDREIRVWYRDHYNNLPPGLAKRDRLPPGLERQLVVRGTLPPGLRKKIQPAPVELVQFLPPPPPDCRHVVIGGSLVLLNTRSFAIVDVFHFEVR